MGSSQKSYSFFESYSFWMSMIYEKIYFMLKVLRIWSHNYQLNPKPQTLNSGDTR
jgi:hypothetical protein